MGHFDWKGEWIEEESPFDKAGAYTLKKELLKELLDVTKKYQGRIKDSMILDAVNEVAKKYKVLK
jgi:hypothetical protein